MSASFYGTFESAEERIAARERRSSRTARVASALALIIVGSLAIGYTMSSRRGASADFLQVMPHACPEWPLFCLQHEICASKFHNDGARRLDATMCNDYYKDCLNYCIECKCRESPKKYCAAFIKSCEKPDEYVVEPIPRVCRRITATGEGCGASEGKCQKKQLGNEHQGSTVASCGCATVTDAKGHVYAYWDNAMTTSSKQHSGFAVVVLEPKTLKELEEKFFFDSVASYTCDDPTFPFKNTKYGLCYKTDPGPDGRAAAGEACNPPGHSFAPQHYKPCGGEPRATVNQMATFLEGIPKGRFVAVATVGKPFKNIWSSSVRGGLPPILRELNKAFERMGMDGVPRNATKNAHSQFAGLGVARCADGVRCPIWTGGDFQDAYGQIAAKTANLCSTATGEVDAKGCLHKAGYTWCANINSCVQDWAGGDGGPCPNPQPVSPEDEVADGHPMCVELEAVGEGCNHNDKECGGCGCATIRHKVTSQVKHDHGKGKRGISIVVLDPKTLRISKQTFVNYANLQPMVDFLSETKVNSPVVITTNDEPFDCWRDTKKGWCTRMKNSEYKAKETLNRLLEGMGMPPPFHGNDPEYRASYVAFGRAGCKKQHNCPSYAGSAYKSRHATDVAVREAQICPYHGVVWEPVVKGIKWCSGGKDFHVKDAWGTGRDGPHCLKRGYLSEFEMIARAKRLCGSHAECAGFTNYPAGHDQWKYTTGIKWCSGKDWYPPVNDPWGTGMDGRHCIKIGSLTDAEAARRAKKICWEGAKCAGFTLYGKSHSHIWKPQVCFRESTSSKPSSSQGGVTCIEKKPKANKFDGVCFRQTTSSRPASQFSLAECFAKAGAQSVGCADGYEPILRTGAGAVVAFEKFSTEGMTCNGDSKGFSRTSAASAADCAKKCTGDCRYYVWNTEKDCDTSIECNVVAHARKATAKPQIMKKKVSFGFTKDQPEGKTCDGATSLGFKSQKADTAASCAKFCTGTCKYFVWNTEKVCETSTSCVVKDHAKKATKPQIYKKQVTHLEVCNPFSGMRDHGKTSSKAACAKACDDRSACKFFVWTADRRCRTYLTCSNRISTSDASALVCKRAKCVQVKGISEGCDQKHRQACPHNCGCASMTISDTAGTKPQSVQKLHQKGRRGTLVVTLDPQTLEMANTQFFRYTQVDTMAKYIEELRAGQPIVVATNDEPFHYWRGAAETRINAALEHSGIPPPPPNPEWRGSLVGFGLTGCVSANNCPQWAGSQYTSRYGNKAVMRAAICPEFMQGACQPSGVFSANECCRGGYSAIESERECKDAFALLKNSAMKGTQWSALPANHARNAGGCIFNSATKKTMFNFNDMTGRVVAGTDEVMCRRKLAAVKYAGAYKFEDPNPECKFTLVGANFLQSDGAYPRCPLGFVPFGAGGGGFCCKGPCAVFSAQYEYSPDDEICAIAENPRPSLFDRKYEYCKAEYKTNDFCMWALGPAAGSDSLKGWRDYVVSMKLSFAGVGVGINVRTRTPADKNSERYTVKLRVPKCEVKPDVLEGHCTIASALTNKYLHSNGEDKVSWGTKPDGYSWFLAVKNGVTLIQADCKGTNGCAKTDGMYFESNSPDNGRPLWGGADTDLGWTLETRDGVTQILRHCTKHGDCEDGVARKYLLSNAGEGDPLSFGDKRNEQFGWKIRCKPAACLPLDKRSAKLSMVRFDGKEEHPLDEASAEFFLTPSDLTWTQAESHCVKNGGHLASVHSKEQDETLSAMARSKIAPAPAFIGGMTESAQGSRHYRWVDGSQWDYENSGFARGSASSNYVYYTKPGGPKLPTVGLCTLKSVANGKFLHSNGETKTMWGTIAQATSCRGWDCTVEGQFCPPGVPGSDSVGYCCVSKRWVHGTCSQNLDYGWRVETDKGTGVTTIQAHCTGESNCGKTHEKYLQSNIESSKGTPKWGTLGSTGYGWIVDTDAAGVTSIKKHCTAKKTAISGTVTTKAAVTFASENFASKNGCMDHKFSLSGDHFEIKLKARMTDTNGWRAIRNDDNWSRGDLHFQFRDRKLEFSIHGNNPTDQWFDFDFNMNPSDWVVKIDDSKMKFKGKDSGGKDMVAGDGDCDYDSDCKGDLKCGTDNCGKRMGRNSMGTWKRYAGHPDKANWKKYYAANTSLKCYSNVKSADACTAKCAAKAECTMVFYGNYSGGRCCLKKALMAADKVVHKTTKGQDDAAPYGTYYPTTPGWVRDSNTKWDLTDDCCYQAKEYDIKVVYDKDNKYVSLWVDGKFQQQKTYHSAISAKIQDGKIGCWNRGGTSDRKFKGTIRDFVVTDKVPTSVTKMSMTGSKCPVQKANKNLDNWAISFKAKMTTTAGWHAVRNDDDWSRHDMHFQFLNGDFQVGVNGGPAFWLKNKLEPTGKFQANKEYAIRVEYVNNRLFPAEPVYAKLYVDGKLADSGESHSASRVTWHLRDARIGCWKSGGKEYRQFKGDIKDLVIEELNIDASGCKAAAQDGQYLLSSMNDGAPLAFGPANTDKGWILNCVSEQPEGVCYMRAHCTTGANGCQESNGKFFRSDSRDKGLFETGSLGLPLVGFKRSFTFTTHGGVTSIQAHCRDESHACQRQDGKYLLPTGGEGAALRWGARSQDAGWIIQTIDGVTLLRAHCTGAECTAKTDGRYLAANMLGRGYSWYSPDNVWRAPPVYTREAAVKTGWPVKLGKTTDFGLRQSSFSMFATVYRKSARSGDMTIFGETNKGTFSVNNGVHFVVRNGEYYMGFYGNDCVADSRTGNRIASKVGEWERVAFVYDEAARTQTIFVLGMGGAFSSVTCTSRAPLQSDHELSLGQWASDKGRNWDGEIRDVKIYADAMTSARAREVLSGMEFAKFEMNPVQLARDAFLELGPPQVIGMAKADTGAAVKKWFCAVKWKDNVVAREATLEGARAALGMGSSASRQAIIPMDMERKAQDPHQGCPATHPVLSASNPVAVGVAACRDKVPGPWKRYAGHPDKANWRKYYADNKNLKCYSNVKSADACTAKCAAKAECTMVFYGNYSGGRCCLKQALVAADKVVHKQTKGQDDAAPYGTYYPTTKANAFQAKCAASAGMSVADCTKDPQACATKYNANIARKTCYKTSALANALDKGCTSRCCKGGTECVGETTYTWKETAGLESCGGGNMGDVGDVFGKGSDQNCAFYQDANGAGLSDDQALAQAKTNCIADAKCVGFSLRKRDNFYWAKSGQQAKGRVCFLTKTTTKPKYSGDVKKSTRCYEKTQKTCAVPKCAASTSSIDFAGDPHTLPKTWSGGSMWWYGWSEIHDMRRACAKAEAPKINHAQDFTAIASVRRSVGATNAGADQPIFSMAGPGGILFGLRDGKYVMNFGDRHNQEIRSPIKNTPGEWEQVAFIYGGGKAQIVRLSARGEIQASTALAMTPYNLLSFSQDVYAGGAKSGAFPGTIRDVSVRPFAMHEDDLKELWKVDTDARKYGWTLKCIPDDQPLTVWRTSETAKGTGICHKRVPFIAQNKMYDVKVEVKGQRFDVILDGVKVESYKDSTIEAGGIGLETWKATLQAVDMKFGRSWMSDDTIVKCKPMVNQPSTQTDRVNGFTLTPAVAQQVCDAFRGAGCGGFLYTSRAAQEARNAGKGDTSGSAARASVVYCQPKSMLTHEMSPTKASPVGYYRAGAV